LSWRSILFAKSLKDWELIWKNLDTIVEAPQKKRKEPQMGLFNTLGASDPNAPVLGPNLGETVLDRVHQSMILFTAGRGEALKRLIVESEAGYDPRSWRLAQSLSAFYPKGSGEKRWVDGVLGRKKSLEL
jgi:putative DNA methylase